MFYSGQSADKQEQQSENGLKQPAENALSEEQINCEITKCGSNADVSTRKTTQASYNDPDIERSVSNLRDYFN